LYQRPFYYTQDGGVTWTQSGDQLLSDSWGIFGIKSTPIFIATGDDGGGDPNSVKASHIYRSTDYGRNWDLLLTLPWRITGGMSGYGNTVYVQRTSADGGGLFRTRDAGQTWVPVGGPGNRYNCRFAVTKDAIFAFDSLGGAYVTTDGGDGDLPQSSLFHVSLVIDSTKSGRWLHVLLYPDSVLTESTIRSLTGVIGLNRELYGILAIPMGRSIDTQLVNADSSSIHFTIAISSALPLDPSTPLLDLPIQMVLLQTPVDSIIIDSLLINGDSPIPMACAVATSHLSAAIPQFQQCGDSILKSFMRDNRLFQVNEITPNPVTSSTGYRATIGVETSVDGDAELMISDAIGRTMFKEIAPILSGRTRQFTVDLSRFSGGSYFYEILFTSNSMTSNRNGMLLLVK
jgi:hypothetical protein